MARPNQGAIDTFMSITGASESVAIQKLEEHAGNLNEAVNAHFSEGDRNIPHETSAPAPPYDFMDVDDPVDLIQDPPQRPPFSLLPSPNLNPFSLLDANSLSRTIFDSGPGFSSGGAPFVSHPREVREIPIEVKDENEQLGQSSLDPTIQEVTAAEDECGTEIHGTVVVNDEDDDEDYEIPTTPRARGSMPSAPRIDNLPADFNNIDIEEEMIRAAIEASKREAELGYSNQSDLIPSQTQPPLEDAELAHAVSLSLRSAEEDKAIREMGEKVGPSDLGTYNLTEMDGLGKLTSPNGRLEVGGSSSIQDEAEDEDDKELPLIRHRSRHMSSGSIDASKEDQDTYVSPPLSPIRNNINQSHSNESDFHMEEWGGISSEEHDEAVMLEAALFGGIPEGSGYRLPYAPHQFMQNGGLDRTVGPYPRPTPRPPSPSLTAQRLIREQQDDEYLASLQADREKELRAMEEAEARRLEEQAAREAALAEERQKEEESRKKFEEEQELERQLAAKEASLPQEPSPGDENAVALQVRMPDGSRRGRRFLKSDKLQYLYDFIDIAKVVMPGTYRLVRPYPRRAFTNGERALTLNELGLSSKHEALYLELI